MAAVPPEGNGFNFVFSWGFVEWALTGIVGAGVSVAAWVWGLGVKIDRLIGENMKLKETIESLSLKVLKQEADMDLLAKAVAEKYMDNAIARERLKSELLERIAALPTQRFIEERLIQQTTRIDSLITAKLKGD